MLPPLQMPAMATVARGAYEECLADFDANPRATSITEAIALPDGTIATIRCNKSKKGVISATIRMPNPPGPAPTPTPVAGKEN